MTEDRTIDRATQELDVYRSDSLEEEVEREGYHISPIGALLVFVGGTLLIPIAIYPDITNLLISIIFLFLIGTVLTRQSQVKTVLEFSTTKDALIWGISFGGIITVVETVVAGIPLDFRTSLMIDDVSMLFLIICVGAIAEELIYRGGLQTFIKQYFEATGLSGFLASLIAIFIGALTFALGHMFVFSTWNYFAALFVGGLLFGAAYEYKKDLTVPILAHLILNLSTMRAEIIDYAFENWLVVLLLLIVTLLFIYLRRI